MSKTSAIPTIPVAIACDQTAIENEHREQHTTTVRQLLGQVQKVEELPLGYAFQLPNDSDTILQAAKFITDEQQCCPFFNFILEIKAVDKSLWLKLTGPEDVKEALQGELGHYLDETVALATGMH